MDRRGFLAAGGLAAAAPLLGQAAAAAANAAHRGNTAAVPAGPAGKVQFTWDGLGLDTREYAALLDDVTAAGLEADYYSNGGVVGALERRFAQLLGKEAAMFVPTGTLANHLAIRRLAGDRRRVLVQAESHLYNDTGDGAATLGGLNLVPLAPGGATPTLADVREATVRSAGGRVPLLPGAISIENPVRRRDHEMVDADELARVLAFARDQRIPLHLDGARLFTLPRHSGRSVREHAAPFDTVYVSLWKHFNAASGAILAGTAEFIDGLFHVRRMFGGSLPAAWPVVAPALRHVDTFERDYAAAWQAADRLIALLDGSGRFRTRKLANGTSRFFLSVTEGDPAALVERTDALGVSLQHPNPDTGEIAMQVNPTLLRMPPEAVAHLLVEAAGG